MEVDDKTDSWNVSQSEGRLLGSLTEASSLLRLLGGDGGRALSPRELPLAAGSFDKGATPRARRCSGRDDAIVVMVQRVLEWSCRREILASYSVVVQTRNAKSPKEARCARATMEKVLAGVGEEQGTFLAFPTDGPW